MKEETIQKVASALDAWNPLGERANSVEGLDGYRIEAIDIISTIRMMSGSNKVEKAIAQVLSQAFNIEVNKETLSKAATEISDIINLESKSLN